MSRTRWWTGAVTLALSAALALALHRALQGTAPAVAFGGNRYLLRAPELLASACVVPWLAWSAWGSLVDLPLLQRAVALCVRALLFACLALALARPAQLEVSSRVSAVLLVDTSESISDPSLAAARAFLARAMATRGEHDLQLVAFDGRPRRISLAGKAIPRLDRAASEPGAAPHTDIASALQLAYGLFLPGHLRRVAILSDGLETRGDLLREADHARQLGVRLYHRLLDEGAPAESAVRSVTLPDQIRVGENFEVRAKLFATRATRARVRLYQGSLLNGLDGLRTVDLARGDTEVVFKSVVRTPGSIDYRVELEPEGSDRFAANNQHAVTAVVPGRPTVLLVEEVPALANPLAQALTHAGYEVDLRSALAFPRTLAELQHHDFVILSDVPAERLSVEQMELVERYVRDVGGGFLMAGGEHAFGLGGYQGTRLEDVLPVRMDSERRRDELSLALALVLDCSGSMSGAKMDLAKEAARATADLLGAEDSIAVIGFAGEPDHVVRMQSARNRVRILQSIGQLAAQGGTAIFPALDAAFQDLVSARARVKHVILLTDGQTREAGIPELAEAMRAEGITITTVGLGTDVNRGLLQDVANAGGGRAYVTDDPHNVPRIFVRETATVGRNSAVEELFQPSVTAPADFLRGVDLERAPFLRGYVATQAKPAPAQVILASDLGEPLLARWRVGVGWALAWTSDVKSRWAADWLRWPGFGVFWGELVREHMRQERQHELPMHAEVRDGAAHVTVDAIGPDDAFLDGLVSELEVTGPAGTREPRHTAATPRRVALRQTAPGRYEARVPLEGYGSFALRARHSRDGRAIAHSTAQVGYPYPREYAANTPDAPLLARAAALTGGTDLSTPERLFAPGADRVDAYAERWPSLVFVALALFLVDLLLRRVRWRERT